MFKKFYVEYNNGLQDRNCWCVMEAQHAADIRYTLELYGFVFVSAHEM